MAASSHEFTVEEVRNSDVSAIAGELRIKKNGEFFLNVPFRGPPTYEFQTINGVNFISVRSNIDEIYVINLDSRIVIQFNAVTRRVFIA